MKTITFTGFILIGLCMGGSPIALAQNKSSQSFAEDNTTDAIMDRKMQLLRKDIRSIKKQLITENLTLTDSDATNFWQLHVRCSADTTDINNIRTKIIKDYSEEYGTLTDEQADSLIRRWLDTGIEQSKLRQLYMLIFRKILTGKKAATFFQLDRRIGTMIDLQVASQLPPDHD